MPQQETQKKKPPRVGVDGYRWPVGAGEVTVGATPRGPLDGEVVAWLHMDDAFRVLRFRGPRFWVPPRVLSRVGFFFFFLQLKNC
jgi:hypothetical protein